MGYDNNDSIIENEERIGEAVSNAASDNLFYLHVIRGDYLVGTQPTQDSIPEQYEFRFNVTVDNVPTTRNIKIHRSRIIPFFNTLVPSLSPMSSLQPVYKSLTQYLDFMQTLSQRSRNALTRYLKSPLFECSGGTARIENIELAYRIS